MNAKGSVFRVRCDDCIEQTLGTEFADEDSEEDEVYDRIQERREELMQHADEALETGVIAEAIACDYLGEAWSLWGSNRGPHIVFESICPKGHEQRIKVINFRHSVLFEHGILSLSNGNTSAAVMQFAMAIESFLEEYAREALSIAGIEADIVNETWRQISSQSQRQIGFLYGIFVAFGKRRPPKFPEKLFELRNRVAHQGHLPSWKEALQYGEDVYKLLEEYLNYIRAPREEGMKIPDSPVWLQARLRESYVPLTDNKPYLGRTLKIPLYFDWESIGNPRHEVGIVSWMGKREADHWLVDEGAMEFRGGVFHQLDEEGER